MFSKLVALCALVAVSQAGLLAEPAHYSSAGAVSSQSIVRHDESHGHQLVAAPVAKLAVAAPVYHAAPQLQYAAPQAHYAAPQVHYAAPQAHYAAPQVHYAAPQAHYAAPQVHYAAPQVHYAAPVAKVLAPAHKLLVASHDEEYAHPKYEYAYSVADGHTGDNKSQQETRDGDVVKGSYSLHEADGSIRTVEYSADDHSGFNAVVHNTAPTHAPAYVKAAPLLVKAAPALQYYHH